jgi:hypothetical protein
MVFGEAAKVLVNTQAASGKQTYLHVALLCCTLSPL